MEKPDQYRASRVLGARTLEARRRRSIVFGSISVWITVGGRTLGHLMNIEISATGMLLSKFNLLYFDYYSQGFLGIRVCSASDVLNENFKHLILSLHHQNPIVVSELTLVYIIKG